jgi:hypothetical protein
MNPIRIRLYGLMTVTKRGYLTQLALSVLLLVALLVIRLCLPDLSWVAESGAPARLQFFVWLLTNLHWIVLAFGILFALEAFIVLRAFAREEAKQKAERDAALLAQVRKPGN